ncbi:heteromeric transposase endonuclease subunit TnsA [Nitrogeniibacter mangrovi]|uniref:Heteromeric transposase endonuclease subunit TnsA n=1 Tax=Nitrogeniibacter mangrovi TaxID=2016596 RepID=A0A6C1B8S4_9RHOO|nr:TnsA endonuclease N-terminal domain-containing protein [Nitrogeniibacter mangrovi]QID19359.1 heteromeric transposase endonuclease subunit TnsA [Nitrogeniibacter mangrovi]
MKIDDQRAYVQQITRLDISPARKIGTNRRSMTGQTAVGGFSVAHESSLERDFLILLDFDRNFVEIRGQPVRIGYKDAAGRDRHYTPDVYVEYTNGEKVLYEVKYRENLKSDWIALKPRFKAAIRFARANEMRFALVTEVEIRGSAYLANAKFLRPYRAQMANVAMEEHLLETLDLLGDATPDLLLKAAFSSKENRIRAVGPLWRLVCTKLIGADLTEPLTMATSIWCASREATE